MSLSHSPSVVTNGLLYYYDMSNTEKSWKGSAPSTNLLLYSDSLNAGLWAGYCGNTSNVTYKTTDVLAPDGSYNSTKLVMDGSTSCGPGGAWGLLYGQSAIFTSGQTYTVSIWARCLANTMSMALGMNDSFATTVTLTTTWQRFSYTATITGNLDRGLQFIRGDSTNGTTFYVWGAQCEQNSFVTPYMSSSSTSGTRSTTNNLIDLIGRSTATTSLVYNSNNTFSFNYTLPGYVSVPLSTAFNKTTGTINMWVYPTSYNGGNGYFVNREDSTPNAVDWFWIGPYSDSFYFRIGNGSDCCSNDLSFGSVSTVIPLNTWTNMSFTWSANGTSAIYKNGLLYTSRAIGAIPATNPAANGRFGLGHANADGYFNGQIPVAQIYNRQLSDSEILQNFNALRGRYGV